LDLSNIPSNLDFYFDDNLREVPVSTIDMIKGIEFKKNRVIAPKIMRKNWLKHMVSLVYIQELSTK
jgi:hypothetical protein